jgi:hypothetical protein
MKSMLLALARYQDTWHVMLCDVCVLPKARGKLQRGAFTSRKRLGPRVQGSGFRIQGLGFRV